MGKFLKISLRILVVLIIILAAVGFWQREKIMRLLAVNSLFSEEKIVNNFSHMDSMFLTTPLSIGAGEASELPIGDPAPAIEGLDDWIKERSVTALVVLKDGKIVTEQYFLGTGKDDLRISWSVAKSYLADLMGILVAEGKIGSLDEQVVKYAPHLKGSAYEGATIRNVLNMASGVKFNEDYLDFNSDINKMGRVIALGGTLDDFAAGIKERENPPGTVWQYVSIDTHVIGMVIRGATERSIPDLLSEKILVPLGLEKAPYYITDGSGVAFVLGGLNMTTRDYARFGLMNMYRGQWNGKQIVPQDWIEASTVPSAPTAEGQIGYGYQWWIPIGAPKGEYMARGVYGQYIYINTGLGVVIASNAADRKFREEGVTEQSIEMFRKIAAAL